VNRRGALRALGLLALGAPVVRAIGPPRKDWYWHELFVRGGPTLLDHASLLQPNQRELMRILEETNEMLETMVWKSWVSR
jgi:hypothetical protein